MRNVIRTLAAAGCLALVTAAPASAGPIILTEQLLGDPRPGSPDNLIVDVSVELFAADVTKWTVDLNMPLHPDAKLDVFAFNLFVGPGLTPLTQYSITDVNPLFDILGPAVAPGGGYGNNTFALLLNDTAQNSNVTNTVSLTFTVTKTTGAFLATDFTSAPCTESNDPDVQCHDMVAHLQSLTFGLSGVAVGDYSPDLTVTPTDVVATPEPASIILLGSGGIAAALARRRRRKTAK